MVDLASLTNHAALFYTSKEEYFNVVVPYLKAGLENDEFCLWVVPETITTREAETYLRKLVEDLDLYIKREQISIREYQDVYLPDGLFIAHKMIEDWAESEADVLQKGFTGLRIAGDGSWAVGNDWFNYSIYEQDVNNLIEKYKMTALCTYSIERLDVKKIHEIGINHKASLVHRMGNLDRLSPDQFKRPGLY